MECNRQLTILLTVSCLLTVNGRVRNSSDSRLQFTVYESCMIVVKSQASCRFVVAFSRCVDRSGIKIIPKGQTAEILYNTTVVQDGREWHQENSSWEYSDNAKILAYPCACNTNVADIAIQADLYNEWVPQPPHVSRSGKLCLLELVHLFRVSDNISCTQYRWYAVNILCQLPVTLLTGLNCLRTGIRLRACYGYQTSQHQVCICALRHNVRNSALRTKGSSPGQTFVPTEQEPPNAEKTDIVMAENVYDDKQPSLCGGRVPDSNCSRVLTQRSLDPEPCLSGKFGKDCGKQCHCKNKAGCHQVSGQCPSDCEIGWKGITCSRRRCPRGRFGVDIKSRSVCTEKCLCGNPDDCHVVTGECIEGFCLDNTTGIICAEQICPRRYTQKPNCTTKCYCYNDMVCNPYTGKCPGSLCQSGYLPPTCTAVKTSPLVGKGNVLVLIELCIVAMKVAVACHLRVIPIIF